jgi:hypothetical protein
MKGESLGVKENSVLGNGLMGNGMRMVSQSLPNV